MVFSNLECWVEKSLSCILISYSRSGLLYCSGSIAGYPASGTYKGITFPCKDKKKWCRSTAGGDFLYQDSFWKEKG